MVALGRGPSQITRTWADPEYETVDRMCGCTDRGGLQCAVPCVAAASDFEAVIELECQCQCRGSMMTRLEGTHAVHSKTPRESRLEDPVGRRREPVTAEHTRSKQAAKPKRCEGEIVKFQWEREGPSWDCSSTSSSSSAVSECVALIDSTWQKADAPTP